MFLAFSPAALINKFFTPEGQEILLQSALQTVKVFGTFTSSLCGLFALIYISTKIWAHWVKAEPIDIYPLLRPFVILIIITNFDVFVTAIRGLTEPLSKATYAVKDQFKRQVASNIIDAKAKDPNPRTSSCGCGSLNIGCHISCAFNQVWTFIVTLPIRIIIGIITMLVVLLADLMVFLAEFGLRVFSIVYLTLLILLGPLAFTFSIFDKFKDGAYNWIGKFIQVSLWVPVLNLVQAIHSAIMQIITGGNNIYFGMGLTVFDPNKKVEEVLGECIVVIAFTFTTAGLYAKVPEFVNIVLNVAGMGEGKAGAGAGGAVVGGLTSAAGAVTGGVTHALAAKKMSGGK